MKEYFVWLAKFITVLVVVLIFIPLLLGAIGAAASSSFANIEVPTKKGVAVVPLKGMITEADEVLEKLHKNANDDDILGIILDIDSPGGSVAPSQQIYTAVKELKAKKPIIAVMNSVAASGGLYASLAATKVYCQPGTLTGSIGVILQLPNFTKITEQIGFQMVTIKSGELKDVGNSFRPMSTTDKDFLQASVNKVREDFVGAVIEGRNLEADVVNSFADGRIILGTEAIDYGLADQYGTIYDAGREIYKIAEEPLADNELPTLIKKEDKFERIKEILESSTGFLKFFESVLAPNRGFSFQ